ncbi:MAG: hypothetical protein ACFB0C_15595 [Leptolyngbyaceae cyanobacterium]
MTDSPSVKDGFGDLPLDQLAAIAAVAAFFDSSKFSLDDALKTVGAFQSTSDLSCEAISRGLMGGTLFIHAYDGSVTIKDTPEIEA